MFVPTQAEIENELRRFDELRAELAMQRLASAARPSSSLPSRWHGGHLRAGLGRAVTWLAAFVMIG